MACVTNLQYEQDCILKDGNFYIHTYSPVWGQRLYCLHSLGRKFF
jgi:hypothetical protein